MNEQEKQINLLLGIVKKTLRAKHVVLLTIGDDDVFDFASTPANGEEIKRIAEYFHKGVQNSVA